MSIRASSSHQLVAPWPHERRAGRLPDEVPKGKQDPSADGTGAVSCTSREPGTPTASSVGSVRGRAVERVAMA